MKTMRTIGTMVLMWLCNCACSALVSEIVEYKARDVSMKGYLGYDGAVIGKRPGVMVVHEWWGLNDYARRRARMLAEPGYTAFVIDMYGEGKNTEHPQQAGAFAAAVRNNMPAARARFHAAMQVLKKHPTGVYGKQ